MRCFLNVPALSAIPGERAPAPLCGSGGERRENAKKDPGDRGTEEAFLQARVLREGSDVTIISAGEMTRECAESCRILESRGIRAELIDARVLKPLDRRTFEASAAKTGLVFVAEDNVATGRIRQLRGGALCLQSSDRSI